MKSFIWTLFIFALLVLSLNFSGFLFAQENFPGIIRGAHAGGNWGENRQRGFAEQPADYYKFLRNLSVDWVGLTIGLHLDNSMDATIERDYSDALVVPTLSDDALRSAIQGFKSNNMNVMLSLAIEGHEASQSELPFQRWQLGDTFAHNNDPNIQAENWPWNPGHPDHQTFIQTFWESYAEQAAYFARIAEEEGAGIFAIGVETDRLFRTRISGLFPNEFKDYIQAVVDSVKKYFSGLVTYEQHWGSLTDQAQFGESIDHIWEDVGLDIIGISAYFQLTDEAPNRVYTTAELEEKWGEIFNNHLIPLQNRHPNLPVYFLEFGYVDVVASLFNAASEEFDPFIFQDNNGNGLDDGREQQANAYESFFNINAGNNYLIKGTFLWDFQIASEPNWNAGFGLLRTFSVRNKLAENVVIDAYVAITPMPGMPVLLSPADGEQDVFLDQTILQWEASDEATSYNLLLSDYQDFFPLVIDETEIIGTELDISLKLVSGVEYWWKVQAVNAAGQSNWTDPFSFQTLPCLDVDENSITESFALFQNYPNPFNPSTIISYQLPTTANVKLTIYDALGNEITTLVNKEQPPGFYKTEFDAASLSSGVYIYKITAGDFQQSAKMMFLK